MSKKNNEVMTLLSLLTDKGEAYERLMEDGEDIFLKVVSAVVENNDRIMITDLKGKIEYVNPAFEELTGYTKREVVGKISDIIKSRHENPDIYEKMTKEINDGKVFRGEFVSKKKTGTFFYQQETITPIKDKHGKITHFVTTGRDIAEERRVENCLKIVGKITTTVIRQIDVPVKQIQLATYNLREYVQKQKDLQPYKDLEKIYNTTKQIDEVIKILLELVKSSSTNRSRFSLRKVIETALAQMQDELNKRKVKVRIEIDESVSSAKINFREWQFIFFQLTHHAVEGFASGGGIITWKVTKNNNVFEISMTSTSECQLDRIRLKCELYDQIQVGNFDLELLLVEKIINDYGATINYRFVNNKQTSVILLPQVKTNNLK